MSVQAIAWAFEQDVEPGAKFVLVTLANFTDDKGRCWPSISTIVRMTGLSESSVHRHVRALIDAGVLVREDRPGTSNMWHIPQLAGVSPWHPWGPTVAPRGSHPGTRSVNEPSVDPSSKGADAPLRPEPNPGAPNDMEAYLLRRLHELDERWSKVTFGAVVKLNRRFGRPVVLMALQRIWEEKPSPDKPYPFFVAVCNEVSSKVSA